jgi:site-specific recombinase XerD
MAVQIAPSAVPAEVQSPGTVSQNGSQGRFGGSSDSGLPAGFSAPLDLFLESLEGRNVSPLTILAYGTDLRQFFSHLVSTNAAFTKIEEITQDDVREYLASLAKGGRSGVTRARKLASIRQLFTFLAESKLVKISPAEHVAIPKKEKKQRVYLRVDEYMRMLACAGDNARDFAILQLFLQTGIRVAELVSVRLGDVDLQARTLTVEGKGQKTRVIDLEKKGVAALQSYLKVRPQVLDDQLFLNYEKVGISDRGVKKIVEKYRQAAGITKQIGCHSLRHTFGTYKARKGISAFRIQQWLGHSSVTTTQIYVHLGHEEAKKEMEATSL